MMVRCVDGALHAAVKITAARRVMVYSAYTMRALALSLAACTSFGGGKLPPPTSDAAVDTRSIDAPIPIDANTYHAPAVEFDTSGNDYLSRGAVTSTDSASGTASMWIKFLAGDGVQQDVVTATVLTYGGGALRTNTNHIRFVMMNCSGGSILDIQSQNAYTTANGWIHVLASWDLVAARADLYINDNQDRAVGGSIVNSSICYHATNWAIGGVNSGAMNAELADLYVDLGRFTELTDPNERRKFDDGNHKPVPLGASCIGPSGNQPTLCFDDATDWTKDQGTGGDFTVNGNGIAAAPDSPSD